MASLNEDTPAWTEQCFVPDDNAFVDDGLSVLTEAIRKKRKRLGKRSRDKGAAGERELAAFLKPWFPDAKRGVGQSQSGDNQADIVGTAPLFVECKRRKRIAVIDHLKQCESAASGRGLPVVFMREDRGEWVAMVKAEHFLQIVLDLIAPQPGPIVAREVTG
jgi:Holliday junction resolvase